MQNIEEKAEPYLDSVKNGFVGVGGKILAAVLFIILLVLVFGGKSKEPIPTMASRKVVMPDSTTVDTSVAPAPRLRPRPQSTRRPSSSRNKRSVLPLQDYEQTLFDSLESSTRAYLVKVLPQSLLDKYEFDEHGILRKSINHLFKLEQEAIIQRYQNKIVNSIMLDTLRTDTIDIKYLLYK